jgi:hypothetical protein
MKLTLKSLFSNIWVNLLLVLSFAAGFIGIFIRSGLFRRNIALTNFAEITPG